MARRHAVVRRAAAVTRVPGDIRGTHDRLARKRGREHSGILVVEKGTELGSRDLGRRVGHRLDKPLEIELGSKRAPDPVQRPFLRRLPGMEGSRVPLASSIPAAAL
jgi:hypothetical protein